MAQQKTATVELIVEEHTSDYGHGPSTSLIIRETGGMKLGSSLWHGEKPQLPVVRKRLRLLMGEDGVGTVIVGDMFCGELKRLNVDGISLGGTVFPLTALRDQDMQESGFLSTLWHIEAQNHLYLVGGRHLVQNVLKAVSLHLSLIQLTDTGYVWPDGSKHDAY
jgi:hypothetical protein